MKLKPDYVNALYFLGLIYNRLGDKQAALEQFEKALKLNPNNKDIKKIIENLKTQSPTLEEIVPFIESSRDSAETPVKQIKRR